MTGEASSAGQLLRQFRSVSELRFFALSEAASPFFDLFWGFEVVGLGVFEVVAFGDFFLYGKNTSKFGFWRGSSFVGSHLLGKGPSLFLRKPSLQVRALEAVFVQLFRSRPPPRTGLLNPF